MHLNSSTKSPSQSNNYQTSDWDTSSPLNDTRIKSSPVPTANHTQSTFSSDKNNSTKNINHSRTKKKNDQRHCPQRHWCSSTIQGFLYGSLLAGIALSVVIVLWLTSEKTTMSTISTSTTTTTSTVSTSTTTAIPTCESWLWNTTGEIVAGVTGVPGTAPNQLNEPWNIYVDSSNILYIADSQNHRIQRWLPGALTGTTVAGTGTAGSTSTDLNTPRDVFVDSSQNIYIADSNNNRVQFFASGSITGVTLSSSWSSLGSLWGVQVVNESIYACDNSQSAIWNNGSAVAGNQGSGSAPNQLNKPQGFAVDTSVVVGTVYVANSQQHTIVQWPFGTLVGNIVAGVDGVSGSSSILLKYPVSVKLDSYTNMFVVDNNNHRIQLFCRHPTINITARTIAGTGTGGQTSQTLNYPAGLTLDASLNLYVADTSNHRVQKFQRLL